MTSVRLCALLVTAVFIPLAGANADAGSSGNQMIPGCRLLMDEKSLIRSVDDGMRVGECAGVITTLYYVAKGLPSSARFCPPSSVTVGQAARVIVKYLDDKPELLHGDFRDLAIQALRRAWPC